MNTAIRPYLNSRKVPQLFVVSGSPKFNDPKHYPWTTGSVPSNSSEGAIYGALVVKNKPNAKIAVLSQNDDFGRDFLNGFKAAFLPFHQRQDYVRRIAEELDRFHEDGSIAHPDLESMTSPASLHPATV